MTASTQKSKAATLIIIGALVLAASFIIPRYWHLNDFANGVVKGVSIGLLILGVVRLNRARNSHT